MSRAPSAQWSSLHGVRLVGSLALVTAVYFLSARASLQLQFEGSQATPIWPPSGLALASFLLLGLRAGGPVFLGAFLANAVDFLAKAKSGAPLGAGDVIPYFSDHPVQLGISAAIGLGNTLEAAAAHYLIRRLVPDGEFAASVRGVLIFVFAAITSCLVASTIGIANLFAGAALPYALVREAWFTWWLGDLAGMMILTPVIVIWATRLASRMDWGARREILPAVLLALLAIAIFDDWLGVGFGKALAYTLIPLLLWVEVTFGYGSGSLGVGIIAAVAVVGTVHGRGPFAGEPLNDALLDLQSFIVVVAVTAALLSAALKERARALLALTDAHRTLEARVEQRTEQLAQTNAELLVATEQSRLTHAALAKSKEQYKALYIRTPAMMHSIGADGRLLSVSDHWLSTLGYQRDEVVGHRSTEFLTEESCVFARDVVLPEFFRTGICTDVPYRMVKKDGGTIDVLLSGVGERDASGQITRSLAVMVDVTERNKAEAALRASEARLLEEKQRAEDASKAKSEFLANMSHEIRTPLNGVIGLADMLLGSGLTDEQSRHTSLLKDSGKSLLAILNDILDLSKIESGKFELASTPVSMSDIAATAMAIVRPQGEAKGLLLKLELEDDLPAWSLGDPIRLRQILLNLLSNAVKFTDRGIVSLAVAPENRAHGRSVRFTVSDTGIGVPAGREHLLFENFSQIDRTIHRRFGGTGLGLAISKRLVEGMGGDIGFVRNGGGGSTFWFRVPVQATAAPAAPGAVAHPGRGTRALKILIAEDIPINQLVVEAALTSAGHEVALAANGIEAVEALVAGDFDLVLMDVEMPEMDGIVATRTIRALAGPSAEIPIIALTANAMDEQIRACQASGMNDHLAKPIDRELLLAMVEKWSATEAPAAQRSSVAAG